MLVKNMKLSFCDIIKIDNFIIEVIPHQGIDFDEEELKEYHDFYSQLKHPAGVLVNKKYSYSYSFGAQMNITNNSNIAAVAFLVSDPSSISKAKLTMSTIKGDTPIKVFYDRVTAFDWLNRHNNKI